MVLSIKLNWLGVQILLHFSRSLERLPLHVLPATESNPDSHGFSLVCTASQFCILHYASQLPFNSYWSELRPIRHRLLSEVHLQTWISIPDKYYDYMEEWVGRLSFIPTNVMLTCFSYSETSFCFFCNGRRKTLQKKSILAFYQKMSRWIMLRTFLPLGFRDALLVLVPQNTSCVYSLPLQALEAEFSLKTPVN